MELAVLRADSSSVWGTEVSTWALEVRPECHYAFQEETSCGGESWLCSDIQGKSLLLRVNILSDSNLTLYGGLTRKYLGFQLRLECSTREYKLQRPRLLCQPLVGISIYQDWTSRPSYLRYRVPVTLNPNIEEDIEVNISYWENVLLTLIIICRARREILKINHQVGREEQVSGLRLSRDKFHHDEA